MTTDNACALNLLLVGEKGNLPDGFDRWLGDRQWKICHAPDVGAASAEVSSRHIDAVLVCKPDKPSEELKRFLRHVDALRIAAVVVGGDAAGLGVSDSSLIDTPSPNISKEELSWRLSTLARFQAQARRMERELEHMQKLGKRLNQYFREIDDEMRLASRLQRDFLPREIERIGPLRFRTAFRPASWVSGDIYDIQKLDDQHVGIYIADAIGHGVAAGLLTMFIKHSMITRRETDGKFEIVPPGEALISLNDRLARHRLPNCQFVTGHYCVINTRTLRMQYARGGHPYPLLISGERGVSELKSTGGLMGLFPEFECPTFEMQLHPGDKLILFTDGIESAFEDLDAKRGGAENFHQFVESNAALPLTDIVGKIDSYIDQTTGSLQPEDDVTIVGIEVVERDR